MTLTSGGSIEDAQASPAANAVDLRKTYGEKSLPAAYVTRGRPAACLEFAYHRR